MAFLKGSGGGCGSPPPSRHPVEDIALTPDVSSQPKAAGSATVALVILSPSSVGGNGDNGSDDGKENGQQEDVLALLSADAQAAISSTLNQTVAPTLLLVVNPTPQVIPGWEDYVVGATQVRQIQTPDAKNLAQAVSSALEQIDLEQMQWLWLLHDDLIARPDALEQLLSQGQTSRNIGALGPKQVGYKDPSQLLEIGIDATRTARRVDAIEPDEVDQGQYDDLSDVLAVGTAGMLIRVPAWDQAGPLDPALGPFGDGLEYGRRLRRAGYRVVVVPTAVVQHRQRSLGREDNERVSFAGRRTGQLYNWAVAAPRGGLLPLMLWLPILTVSRATARLITRDPKLAWSEVTGYWGLVRKTPALFARRKQIQEVATVPSSVLAPLEADARGIAKANRLKKRIRNQRTSQASPLDGISLNVLRRHRYATWGTALSLLALTVVLSVFLWSPFRSGIEGGSWGNLPESWRTLAAQAWSGWQVSGDGAPGPASPVLVPLAALSAPFALLGLSPADFQVTLLFCALPLAFLGGWLVTGLFTRANITRAALSMIWVAGGVLWLGAASGNVPVVLAYLALPLVLAGLWRGFAPPFRIRVEGIDDAFVTSNPDRSSWLALTAFSLVAVASVSPVLLVVTLVVAVLMATRFTWDSDRGSSLSPLRRAWNIAMLVLPSTVLLVPTFVAWIRHLASTDSARVAGAGFWEWLFGMPAAVSGNVYSPQWWQLFAGYSADASALIWGRSVPDQPWPYIWTALTVLSGLLLLAWTLAVTWGRILEVSRKSAGSDHDKLRVLIFVFAATGVVLWGLALLGGQLGAPATAHGGLPAVLVAAGSLAFLSVAGMASNNFSIGETRSRPWHKTGAAVALIGALATLASMTVLGPLSTIRVGEGNAGESSAGRTTAATESAVISPITGYFPLIAREAQSGSRAARILALTQEGDVLRTELLRGAGLDLADVLPGAPSTNADAAVAVAQAQKELAYAAAVLVSGTQPEAASLLVPHDVDIILLDGSGSNFTDYANLLDATPGLERIGTVDRGTMWRLRWEGYAPSRLALQQEVGVLEVVDAGVVDAKQDLSVDSDSTLVLSESRDSAWGATFDGDVLTPTTVSDGSWRQAWEIPAGQGELVVRYAPDYLIWWQVALGLSALVVAVVAVPWRRKRATQSAVQVADDD